MAINLALYFVTINSKYMNFFKQTVVLLTIAIALFMTACTQDNSTCTPPAVAQNIVGTWTITGGTGTVEFKSDGTLVDPNDDVLGGYVNNDTFSVKTYVVANDTLSVTAASPTTSNSMSGDFPITDNQCDKITISVLGFNTELNRQ
ncbi:hypothetical protein AsAng_0047220 [Aureispira anguillae]|uniref:Lipocalin-like domain-containing protein n=2 Tax=Aureispira anguillae TaxID=2864201 RepID=A0A916DU97_9BACT|nr:hypothetical protein AsAng_0047220 [Aureispira anguillae]